MRPSSIPAPISPFPISSRRSRELGTEAEAVDYVLLTHVHLDHAGGAGLLMQELPNATAVLHPRGAGHLIDPSKLDQGLHGGVWRGEVPQALRRSRADSGRTRDDDQDGQRLDFAGRTLEIVHTPGHALHHHAIVDLAHGNIFTGDTFGMSYRECDTEKGPFIVPTTTPTQFDPEQLIASVRRLAAYGPKRMFLMHFGGVSDVPRLADSMEHQIREFVRIARAHAGSPQREAQIRAEMRSLWFAPAA